MSEGKFELSPEDSALLKARHAELQQLDSQLSGLRRQYLAQEEQLFAQIQKIETHLRSLASFMREKTSAPEKSVLLLHEDPACFASPED